MSEPVNKQRGTPSNPAPKDGDILSKMLEAMSVEELTDALWDELENTTEENYDPEWIDAYLDALNRKDPIPEIPDAETSYRSFKKRMQEMNLDLDSPKRAGIPTRRFGRVWRAGMAAVLTVACILGGMVVAQAAGLDIIGGLAHWTENVFSFGEIRSDGATDVYDNPASEHKADENDPAEFASLQDALDAYGVTEVSEPAWIPEGYVLDSIDKVCMPDGTLWHLSAYYSNGTDFLNFEVESYQDEPNMQIEKTDAPVETFAVNDITAYLLENINSNSVTWVTEHYVYVISGAIEKSKLRQMVLSAYANTQ